MKWNKAAERRVEEYLREVEKHMGHKPESVRGEVKEESLIQLCEGVEIDSGMTLPT